MSNTPAPPQGQPKVHLYEQFLVNISGEVERILFEMETGGLGKLFQNESLITLEFYSRNIGDDYEGEPQATLERFVAFEGVIDVIAKYRGGLPLDFDLELVGRFDQILKSCNMTVRRPEPTKPEPEPDPRHLMPCDDHSGDILAGMPNLPLEQIRLDEPEEPAKPTTKGDPDSSSSSILTRLMNPLRNALKKGRDEAE